MAAISYINFGKRTMLVGDIQLTSGAALYRGITKGKHWYIAQSDYGGADTNPGTSFVGPFATWAKVMSVVSRGDVIHLYGKVASAAAGEVTPVSTPDVTVVGHGGRPRHGNTGIPLGPKGGAAEWVNHASATGPNLTVRSQGWTFINILFNGHASYSQVKLERNNDAETLATGRNGGHAEFRNCVFVGPSTYGIEDVGGNPNVGIFDCNFYGFSTSGNRAIGQSSAAVGFCVQWEIKENRFQSNDQDIANINLMGSEIVGNHFKLISNITGASVTNTKAIEIVGGGRDNWIALNHMHAASNHNGVNARFVPGTNDMFAENYWSDVAEYAEPAS